MKYFLTAAALDGRQPMRYGKLMVAIIWQWYLSSGTRPFR